MPALDSLLRIVDQQGANELRLGSDKAPSMFAAGAPKKLAIPPTTTETLRDLFGELLDASRLAQLDKLGRVEFVHEADKLGAFRITITKRPTGALAFDAIVMRANAAPPAPPAPAPIATVAPRPAPPASSPPKAPLAEGSPYRSTAALDELLSRAISMGASDVHISESDPPVARVHGHLVHLDSAPATAACDAALHGFGDIVEARLAERASCDLAIDLPGGGRGRLNAFRTSRGLALAIRILPRSVPTLHSLGFPIGIDDLANLPNGLVLATGATGSGKSSTLAALAQHAIQTRSAVLVTLEDPIEYVFEATHQSLVRQRQIGRDVRDFATGLRDALREDPDILLIGEMRDAESIQLALTAAETGHLVLASLHSRSAVSAVERIIDTYPAERQNQIRVMLADSLRAVIAQRLLPREGGGRVLAAEVLRVTTSVGSAIREAKMGSMKSAMQSGKSEGMITLERSLADLVKRRAITLEAGRAASNDPYTFAQYVSS